MISALDKKLLRDVKGNIGQVIAIATIVACGVAILVMSEGTLNTLRESRDIYYAQNRFADVFANVKRAPEMLREKVERIKGVDRIETRIVHNVTLDLPGLKEPALGRLVSLPRHSAADLNNVTVLQGRLPNPVRVDEAMVNEAFALANGFKPGDRFSALINGRKRQVVITGVGLSPEFIYALPSGAAMPDDRRFGIVWMGREALEAAFDLDGAFNDISLSLMRGASGDAVIDELDTLLDRFGGLGAYQREDHVSHAFLQSEMDQLRTIGTIIPPIFIVVAAFLLHTVLGRLVEVEREQIGTLKAFGYTNLQIGEHYVKYALIIATIGIVAGFGLGLVLQNLMTKLYMEFYRFPSLEARPSPGAFLIGALVACTAALLGALGSVRRGAQLTPAMAMSPPMPTVYGRGRFSWTDISRRFDGPTRMILRNMMRWPGRAATTVFGVASASGLLISTYFAFDATDVMIRHSFERTSAYDAVVNFIEPQPVAAVRELAKLPGVLAVEAHRDLSVRMIHGPIKENAFVVGIGPEATMKKIVDRNLDAFSVPPAGLTLSSQLASVLRVSRGDRVTLEVLEGKRPKSNVYVSAINEDYIGALAYMDRHAINAMMGESAMAGGAYLKLDPAHENAFYDAVKARPAVGIVILQKIARTMFRETLARSQNTMMTIYQILSAAIAAGVVYNSVRISLSERARELASLRVLGFRKLEVSYILLGQSLILVLLALPFGCAAGYGIAAIIAAGLRTDLYQVPLVIASASYGKAIIVVLTAAIASALFVRRRIDRLDLIAVLKTRD